MKLKSIASLGVLFACFCANAQTSAFTYQGRLNDGAAPANGSYDMEFYLRDASTAGSPVGTTNVIAPVTVSNGLFTVQLDFGASAFSGAARWIEIGVRTNGSAIAYTILAPRQSVSSSPYAIQAANAATVTGAISDSQLSANIPRLNTSANFSSAITATSFSGNGAGVTNVNAATLGGLASSDLWKISGNSNTTVGTHFLGTSDNQALELKVNNVRALRLEPTFAPNTPNVILGAPNNSISGTYGATVGGGGGLFGGNTIGTGAYNSTIGGGNNNSIATDAFQAVIAGGANNQITARSSAVGGGAGNWILGATYSTISGGGGNTISNASSATIPGGANNVAATDYTFAAGFHAQAIHQGSFVWADSSSQSGFASSGINQFLIRATGGVGINTSSPNGSALNVNGTVTATSFSGNINGTNLSGTVSSTLNFSPSSGAPFLVGNANRVTNFNADLLDGLDSTNFWKTGGNSGTTPGTDFIGTSDNQALELKVNGLRGLRIEPTANNAPNVIAGTSLNFVAPTVVGSTISGGGAPIYGGIASANSIMDIYCTIGGGIRNSIQSLGVGNSIFSTIGGGFNNTISNNSYSVICGGYGNTIKNFASGSTIGGGLINTIETNAYYATVSGGKQNSIQFNTDSSTVSGGFSNRTTGNFGVVPGGDQNVAGVNSFAAGHRAKATHTGSFVWADSTDSDFNSTEDNQFQIRASGGIRINDNKIWFRTGTDQFHGLGFYSSGTFAGSNPDGPVLFGCGGGALGSTCGGQKIALKWDSSNNVQCSGNISCVSLTQTSDRNVKENFQTIDAREILQRVAALPITRWNYTNDTAFVRHVGPMAQDFRAAFELGEDDKHINTIDQGGVALAAIQGLNEVVNEKDVKIASLEKRLNELEQLVKALAQTKSPR